MNNQMKNKMESLFCDALEAMEGFHKKTYEDEIKRLYNTHSDLLGDIIDKCIHPEEGSDFSGQIAAYIPEYALSLCEQTTSKRKKDFLLLDYNMAMVTYVTPILNYNRNPHCEDVAVKVIEKWNILFPKANLQSASYEKIDAGFKRRLCYVTTAVCKSLGKADDCYELNVMRDYRDLYLLKEANQVAVVEEYYDIAPTIVKHIDNREDADSIYNSIWEKYLNPCIELIEKNQKEACQQIYCDMVKELKSKYMYS